MSGKAFFFEKKKQKTFTSYAGQVPYRATGAGIKSLLVLFFRKEHAFFKNGVLVSLIIIGAGIGGLAAALSLLRAGADVQVFEQAAALGEVGAGLTLSRGAIQCCEHLGVGAELRRYLAPAGDFAFLHYRTGAVLPAPPRAGEEPHDGHIYRPDLHAILADAVRAFGAERIVLGKRLAGVTQTGGTVTAQFADGTSATGAALIGADGARSAVRREVFGEGLPEFTGKIAYRFMLPAEQAGAFAEVGGPACLFVGRGQVFNRYLVSRGRLLNCVGIMRSDAGAPDGWNGAATVDDVLAAFEGWHPSVRALIGRAPPDRLIKWGIFARAPREGWVQGRVALLGDAAHPMQPFLGLGAAMAIEDATVLGRAFAASADIDEALAVYARRRIPRANAVMEFSKRQGDLFDTTDPADFPPRGAPSHDPSMGAFDPEEGLLF
jgi:salicylate hydroxylase